MGREDDKISKSFNGRSARQSARSSAPGNSNSVPLSGQHLSNNGSGVVGSSPPNTGGPRGGDLNHSVNAASTDQQLPDCEGAVVTAAHLASDAEEALRRQAQREAEDQILSNMAQGVAIPMDKKSDETSADSKSSSRWFCMGLCFVIAVVGAVTGIVVGSSNKASSGSGPTPSPTSLDITPLPTADVNVLLETSRDACDEAIEMVMNDNGGSIFGTTAFSVVQDTVGICDSQPFPNGIGVWYKVSKKNSAGYKGRFLLFLFSVSNSRTSCFVYPRCTQ